MGKGAVIYTPRSLVTAASGISLVLCIAVSGLWLRQRTALDSISFTTARSFWSFNSNAGKFGVIYSGGFVEAQPLLWTVTPRHNPSFLGRERGYLVSGQRGAWASEWVRGGIVVGHGVGRVFEENHNRTFASDYVQGPLVPFASFSIPVWMVVAIAGILPVTRMAIWASKKCYGGSRADLCPTCGYDIRASRDRCPECGKNSPTAIGREKRLSVREYQ